MNPEIHFNKFLRQHNEFIKSLKVQLASLENEEEKEDDEEAIRLLRSVFHVLRDRITIQHSFHVLSNLPAFLKLYYIEGWKYQEKPSGIRSTEDFCAAVEKEYKHLAGRPLTTKNSSRELINVVLNALRMYIDDSGVMKLLAELPPELQILFERKPETVFKNNGLNDLG